MSETNGRITIPSPILRLQIRDIEIDIDALALADEARRITAGETKDDVEYFATLMKWMFDKYEVELLVGELHAVLELSWQHEDDFKKKLLILQGCPPVTDSTPPDSTELPTMR